MSVAYNAWMLEIWETGTGLTGGENGVAFNGLVISSLEICATETGSTVGNDNIRSNGLGMRDLGEADLILCSNEHPQQRIGNSKGSPARLYIESSIVVTTLYIVFLFKFFFNFFLGILRLS